MSSGCSFVEKWDAIINLDFQVCGVFFFNMQKKTTTFKPLIFYQSVIKCKACISRSLAGICLGRVTQECLPHVLSLDTTIFV